MDDQNANTGVPVSPTTPVQSDQIVPPTMPSDQPPMPPETPSPQTPEMPPTPQPQPEQGGNQGIGGAPAV